MKKRLTALAVCTLLLLNACGGPAETGRTQTSAPETVPASSATQSPTLPNAETTTVPQTSDASVPFTAPSAEAIPAVLPGELLDTWTARDYSADLATVYRLTFLADGRISMAVQNEIGELLTLYGGQWWMPADGVVRIEMDPDVASEDQHHIDCACRYQLADGVLRLEELPESSTALIPGSSGAPLSFESGSRVALRESQEAAVWKAVSNYYEAVGGAPYPGYIYIEGWVSDDSVSVHLFEDMGDHTATIAWYTVNVETFQGVDDVTGEEIDFSLYRE